MPSHSSQDVDGDTAVALEQLSAQVQKGEPFLPNALALWRELYMMRPRGLSATYLVWQYLSDVFKRRGYELYVPCQEPNSERFWSSVYPADYVAMHNPAGGNSYRDAFGVFGSRRYVRPFLPGAVVWAANNASGDEFIVKAVSDGQNAKGLNELRILQYLFQKDVKADPRNHTVSVVEFIQHEQYTFAIFPSWSEFPDEEVCTPRTAIESCVQITEGLAFLHEKRIAHLDISIENFVINFFGLLLPTVCPIVERLPITYGIIDFGESVFLDACPSSLAPPRNYAPRPTSAPEVSSEQPFDPFAADVYQTAYFMLEQFYDMTGFTPEFLPILHAMTAPLHNRITMAEAHRRLAALRDTWRDDPDPYVLDVVGIPLHKYDKTYLNTRRVFPGTTPMPADDDEARTLREKRRQERQEEKTRIARIPSNAHMLWVDPVPKTVGCVHGNHVKDEDGLW